MMCYDSADIMQLSFSIWEFHFDTSNLLANRTQSLQVCVCV